MMSIPVIEVKNLSKTFKTRKIVVTPLRGISMKLYPGEFLVVDGPSGCGKTTLLNMLAGLDKFDRGEILIRGKDLQKMGETEIEKYRRSGIGMVFQNFNLIASLTAIENVALPLQFSGVQGKEKYKRAREVLEMVGLKDRSKHYPSELSGGEQQKVAIARAIVTNPWILLVDEPTGNLDSKAGEEIISILQHLNKRYGRTILLVTHNSDYLKYATRVIMMKDGLFVGEKDIATVKMSDKEEEVKYYFPAKLRKFMRVADILSISYKHFRFARTRTFLTVLGMAIGISAIVLFVSLGFGLQKITTSSIASLEDLQTITVSVPENSRLKLTDATVETFKKIDSVKTVSPVIIANAEGELGGTSTTVVVKGVVPTDLDIEQIKVNQGTAFSGSVKAEALISSTALKNFDKSPDGIIGQKINLGLLDPDSSSAGSSKITEITATIVGITGDKSVSEVYVPIELLKAKVADGFTVVDVQASRLDAVETIKKSIDASGYETTAVLGLIDQINKAFLVVQIILGLIGGIALIVASFGIINTMTISLLERTHEIGIMKALGIADRDVKRLFVYESILYGFFGGIAGIVTGWIIGSALNALVGFIVRRAGETQVLTPFVTPYKFAILVFFFSIIISRLAGIYPSRRATKRSPLDALRYE